MARRSRVSFLGSLRIAILLGLALLAGCADFEVKPPASGFGPFTVRRHVPAAELQALARAPSCCAALAELPYRPLDREGSLALKIGPDSPAFGFDTGKSFFAAFRLPDWPRPLEIRVTSRAEVPLLEMPLLLAGMESNRPVFSPALLVLDAQFRVKRIMHEPEGLAVKTYAQPGGGQGEVQVEGAVYIAEAPEDAAYLVILTTDELRARSVLSAGVTIDGFSPQGSIELEARSVPFVRLPVHYRGPAMQIEPGHALSGALFWRANTLLISENGVHYLEQQDGRYLERWTLPFASLVTARVDVPFMLDARLELDAVAHPGEPPQRRTVAVPPPRGESTYSMRRLAPIVVAGIPAGWYREPLAITAAPDAPVVEFRDAHAVASGAGSRVADSAMAGGVVTAGVCGICQTGLCPPEVLLPCAGLFAIGAAVGGAVGIGGELFGGGFKPPAQPPALPAGQVQAAAPVLRSAAGALMAQAALRECTLRRLADGEAWVAQGRRAVPEPRAEAARFVVQAAVQRVALVSNGRPGQAVEEIPVRLVVEGGFVFRDTLRGREEQRPAAWRGPSYTLTEWSAPDGRVLQTALRDACDGLADAILGAAEPLWRDAH